MAYLPAESNTGLFGGNSNWHDHTLFYEYFHGDNVAGMGASHQTGWTGLAAVLYRLFGKYALGDYLKPSLTYRHVIEER